MRTLSCVAALGTLWCGLLPLGRAAARPPKGESLVYFGTYTRQKSKGIYVCRLEAATGKLTAAELAAETSNPSFLAVHPNRRFLYAVSEGSGGGAVSAFVINAGTGALTFLNRVSSGGAGPCHLVVDKTGRNVLVANYGSGSVACLPLAEDGRLAEASAFVQHKGSSVNPKRQQGPHAHSVNLSADNRFAVVADLGLDQVLVYRFDAAKGSLAANTPPFTAIKPGSGPRHFAFHPSGKFAYVINELASTVTGFTYDAGGGVLKEFETISTLPAGFTGESYTAEVQAHPSGQFLYGSNRGHDSIAVFRIDGRRGTLTPLEQVPAQGRTPRNFGIDPTGAWMLVANQSTDNVAVFRIDTRTGRLKASGQVIEVGAPVCVKFVPAR